MLNKRLIPLVLALLMMASCGGKPQSDIAADIQEKYAALDTCSMTVRISADYGDRVSLFTVAYSQTSHGAGSITIEQPPEVAGITASFSDGGVSVEYDGLILEAGKLAGTALTPVDAVPTMITAWASGWPSSTASAQWNNEKCHQLAFSSVVEESTVEQVAWFSVDTLKPVHAETLVDGKLVISCDFTNVEW